MLNISGPIMSNLTEFTVQRSTETEEDYHWRGRRNVFVHICLSFSVCLSVCVKCSLTAESVDLENSFLDVDVDVDEMCERRRVASLPASSILQ